MAALYGRDPGQDASFVARLGELAGRHGADRELLAEALVQYNQAIGNSEAALANARRLAGGDAVAVVTGQQAGVLTGPLYTLYKAAQAVALAREMTDRLRRPVIPVFWIAAEDHDFTEIDHLDLLDRQGELRRLRLPLDPPPSHRSAGHIAAGDAAPALLREALACLPETEFLPGLAADLERLTAAGGSLADWFGRLMAWLLGGQGLVLLDPMQPALRRLAAPFVARLLENSEAVSLALEAGRAKVAALGFEPTVQSAPDAAQLFVYHEGQRLALFRKADGFATRGGEVAWSRREAAAQAAAEPERFSGNVVTRPLLQDYLLPTLAYVAGPGEISYYGLYGPVYQAALLEPPIYVPRAQLTLVEPSIARYLQKQELSLEQALTGLEEARSRRLDQSDDIGIGQLFSGFRGDFDRRYGDLISQVLRLDRSLEQAAAENVKQIHAQFGRLEEKARQQLRKNSETAMRQFDRLALNLSPRGQPQERVLNLLPFLARFGPNLPEELLARVPLARGGRFAVWLGDD